MSCYPQSTIISHLHEGSLTSTTSCVHLCKEEHCQCCSNYTNVLRELHVGLFEPPLHLVCLSLHTLLYALTLELIWLLLLTYMLYKTQFLPRLSLNNKCFWTVRILYISFQYLHASLN